MIELHGPDAGNVAGDQPGVHAFAADRHVAQVRVVNDTRIAGLNFGGLNVSVVQKNDRQERVLVIDVAVGAGRRR